MTLFYDQEKKEKRPRSKTEVILRRFVKISLVLGFMVFLSLMVLSMLGGSHPALKLGLEDYISQVTGYQAEIDKFGRMAFYPRVETDMGGIKLHERTGAGIYDGKIVARTGPIKYSSNFWDFLFGQTQAYEFDVRDINADSGVLTKERIYLEAVYLTSDPEKIKDCRILPKCFEAGAAMLASGSHGKNKIYIAVEFDLRILPGPRANSYSVPNIADFLIEYGPLWAEGHIKRPATGGLVIKIDGISLDGMKNIAAGTIEVSPGAKQRTVILETDGSRFDAKIDHNASSGIGTFTALAPEDTEYIVRLAGIMGPLLPEKFSVRAEGTSGEISILQQAFPDINFTP